MEDKKQAKEGFLSLIVIAIVIYILYTSIKVLF